MTNTRESVERHSSVLLPLVYVACVLTIDTLVMQRVHWLIDWTRVTWTLGDFNLLRCVTWLLVPLLWSAREFDWSYYGWRRWTRRDIALAVVLMGAAIGVIVLVPFLPGVSAYYQPHRFTSDRARWHAWKQLALWNLGWLPGWEFMFRYFLLRRLAVRYPAAAAVFVVAAAEGAYHWNKPALEAVAMVFFSVAASSWAVKRRNGLLPLLVHSVVEVALSVYLVI